MENLNEKKQIEEMAKVLRPLALCPNCLSSLNRDKKRDGDCYRPIGYECSLDRDILKYCEALYNAGYRKQEWISVDERLPERNGRYLTHCNIEGQSLVCILYYCKVGVFNEETVTHWMPLPEAPKMKNTEN